jgi:hypothetical protein
MKTLNSIELNNNKCFASNHINSQLFSSNSCEAQHITSTPKKEEMGKVIAASHLNSYKQTIKGLVGHPVNAETLLHYNSKSIAYSFKKTNNIHPLLTKTEYLLKSFFLSMYSLISRPVYLIQHDKVIIRLFVFLAPKADKKLDTSTIVKGGKIVGASPSIFLDPGQRGNNVKQKINRVLKIKKVRPQIIEILKTQIRPKLFLTLNNLELIVDKIMGYSINKDATGKCKATVSSASEVKHDINISLNGATDSCNILKKETENLSASGTEQDNYPYNSFSSVFQLNLERLSEIFKKILKKEVEFEIIKAQLPFQDSNILAQILGYNANNYKFRRMLKILIPRAVIKNPSKELSYVPTSRPHKQAVNITDSASRLALAASLKVKVKDLNIFFSQPSSYLPPFFFSKYSLNLNDINNTFDKGFTLPSEAKQLVSAKQQAPGKVVCAKLQNEKKNDTSFFFNQLKKNLNSNANRQLLLNRQVKVSYLSGMNIKLAGRLMTQSIRPRFTVQSKQEGSLARVKVHFTEKSRFTGKNKRGAYSFTVSISHVLKASR